MGWLGVTSPAVGRIEVPATADLADVVASAVQAGVRVRAVVPQKEKLEDLYLRVSA